MILFHDNNQNPISSIKSIKKVRQCGLIKIKALKPEQVGFTYVDTVHNHPYNYGFKTLAGNCPCTLPAGK